MPGSTPQPPHAAPTGARLERSATTSTASTSTTTSRRAADGAHHAAASSVIAGGSHGSSSSADHRGDDHLGRSQVFAQLRHGHVQVRMGGPARFALSTPRATQPVQQQPHGEGLVTEMRKHHTVHPLVKARAEQLPAPARAVVGIGVEHDDDGVPVRRGMTRQKTLDRLLHLRILAEDGKIVGSGGGHGNTGTTPSSKASKKQPQQPQVPPSPSPPAVAAVPEEADEEEGQEQADAAPAAAAPAPAPELKVPTPRTATSTPKPQLLEQSSTNPRVLPTALSLPARQGSFFNQPSPDCRVRSFASTSSMGRAGSRTATPSENSASRRRGQNRAANAGSIRGGRDSLMGGEPQGPPSVYDINRSSSVIQETYQVTASKWRLSVLTLSVLCLAAYLLLAVGVYGYGITKWGAVRALYFGVVTMTSVGFGDILPESQSARLFTIFFALIGISIVALAVGEISAHLIEQQNRKMEEFQRLLSKRLKKRTQSRRAKAAAAQVAAVQAAAAAAAGKPTEQEIEMSQHTVASSHSAEEEDHPQKQPTPTNAATATITVMPAVIDLEAGTGSGGGGAGVGGGMKKGMTRGMSLRDMMVRSASKSKGEKKTSHRVGKRFGPMFIKALLPVLVVNAIGAGAIGYMQGWTSIDIAYYAVISSTTIGYGDLHPDATATYLVAIIYIPLAVCAVGNAISMVADYWMQKAEEKRRAAVLNRTYVWEDLVALDENGDEEIDIFEFTIFLLKLWGLVDDQVLAAINERFKELDTDGSGTLTKEDFLEAMQPPEDDGSDMYDEEEEEEQCEGLW